MNTQFLDTQPTLDAVAFRDCLGYESVFLPLPELLYVMEICGGICVFDCVCMCAYAPLSPRCERRSLCVIWRHRRVAYTKFPPAEVMAPLEKRLL